MIWKVDEKAGEISLSLSTKVYRREAVLMAARGLAGRTECFEEKAAKARLGIVLKPKEALPRDGMDALAGDFLREVLNQECRLDTAKRNGAVQRLLITQALYSARKAAEEAAPVKGAKKAAKDAARMVAGGDRPKKVKKTKEKKGGRKAKA